jgi:predicted AlkP superfamily phosphohydrolase/phosphomutase
MPITRTLLVGLDGATFDLLGPWMAQGHLPNLQRLTREGAWGELASTVPPTTAPAWTACFTGVNPGKHGIFDFRESPFFDPRRPLISVRSVRAPKLWHLLNRHGRKAGLLNVPITYPPEPLDGFLVSGMMTPGPEVPFTYPPELKEELYRAVPDYVINVDIPQYDVEDERDAFAFLDEIAHTFDRRAAAFFYLMEHRQWDFFMVVFIVLDRIQHLLWKYFQDPQSRFYALERAPRLRARILEVYQQVDTFLGQLLERLDDRTDLVLVSDHGFGSTKAWINVNRWLQKQGLLRVKPRVQLRKRLFYEAMRLNGSWPAQTLIPGGLRRAIRQRVRQTRSTFRSDLIESIDWEQTQAFFASIPCQGIYINVRRDGQGTVEPGADYEALRQRLCEGLLELRDPRTGEKVMDQVYFREEVYHGPYTHWAPDVLFIARNYAYLGRELLGTRDVIETSMNWANGFHRPNGIFLARGRGFHPGRRVEAARIQDIAPTILYRMGLPVPTYMDGRPLTEAMAEEFLAAQPLQQEEWAGEAASGAAETYSEEESAEIEARLRGLGYMA